MNPKTRQKLTSLYYNWTKPRRDWGLPYNLGDHVHQVRQASQLKHGDCGLSLDELAGALLMPLDYVREIAAALDEGISDEELQELAEVCVKRHKPGEDPEFDAKYKAAQAAASRDNSEDD